MRSEKIKMDRIYTTMPDVAGNSIYAYIRGRKGDTVGFSVMEEDTDTPDFANCGVFWAPSKNFNMLFREHRRIKRVH